MQYDTLTKSGAGILAKQIEEFWKRKGYRGIVAERYELRGMPETYGVRSNIGPTGYPPRQYT